MIIREKDMMKALVGSILASTLLAGPVAAAPDEEKLGKASGYPVGNADNWFYDESVRVGSFTAQGDIPGIMHGKSNELKPSPQPMPLPGKAQEARIRWSDGMHHGLGVDDYLARNRIMGLIVVRNGVIEIERYQYDRTASHRFTSNSIAKSITALAIGIALRDGKIRSLDDRAEVYARKLAGTPYGDTTIRNLLRMASGVPFTEKYDGHDDYARHFAAIDRGGIEYALTLPGTREAPQGTRFSYSSAETAVLGAILRGATGTSVSEYLTPRLWQPIGAETAALWRADKTGLERTGGHFNATLRDYARLAIVLANDGVRPDDPDRRQIIPTDYLVEATDWHKGPDAFRPGIPSPLFGYGYQFWLFPGEKRRFAMLGVYGQMIFIDPAQKLVMVQMSAAADAKPAAMLKDAVAFWQGLEQPAASGDSGPPAGD